MKFKFGGLSKAFLKIIAILGLVVFLRTFIIDFYRVSSESMENTLCVGQIVIVNKIRLGLKTPTSSSEIPFYDALRYCLGLSNPKKMLNYHRSWGLSNLKRNDIVIFNHPMKDEFVVKRCVGLPGDTIVIKDNIRYANSIPQKEALDTKLLYRLIANIKSPSPIKPESLGLKSDDVFERDKNSCLLALTNQQAVSLQKRYPNLILFQAIASLAVKDPKLFPYFSSKSGYNRENYGPIIVPKKGQTVPLNDSTLLLFKKIIVDYEGQRLFAKENRIFINDRPVTQYTFKKDYFFMMGDNRYRSVDSRYWGFVPESMIIGTAILLNK